MAVFESVYIVRLYIYFNLTVNKIVKLVQARKGYTGKYNTKQYFLYH